MKKSSFEIMKLKMIEVAGQVGLWGGKRLWDQSDEAYVELQWGGQGEQK